MQDKPLYTLDKLKEIDDAEDFILQVINIFLETVPANTEALKKACDEKNWEQVYFFAHKIKANVNLLAIDSICDDVKYVEHCAKTLTSLENTPSKVKHIHSTVKHVAQVLKNDFGL